MATHPTTGLTYEDLERFPDDNLRREIIAGQLFVTPAPSTRHQQAVAELIMLLGTYAKQHGGHVFPAPTDVFFSEESVVEPDVLFIREEHSDRIETRFVRSAPDVVVEVSSPSTRRLELHRKRELYERFGVPEYWYVDLEADRIEFYRLQQGRYPAPMLLGRADFLESAQLPGLSIPAGEILGSVED